MKVPFRQGIVYAPVNFLTLAGGQVSIVLPQNKSISITFADGASNYSLSETTSVINAWPGPFVLGANYWLYWDINATTGAKTYGYTLNEPAEGPTAPIRPVNKQIWFDTSQSMMFEYNGVAKRWQRKVCVFAAALYNGGIFVSMSINSPVFTGTQVGDTSTVSSGSLIFDDAGYVLKKGNGQFFTTEDTAVTGVGTNSRVKLESISLSAEALTSISAYTMVRFIDFAKITIANNLLDHNGIYGMIEVDAGPGDVVNVVRDGLVSNPSWNFQEVNAPIYVDSTGQITTTPHTPKAIGLVIAPKTILLSSTTVEDIALIESSVTIFGPLTGVVVSGTTGPRSSVFNVSLTGDLAAVENIVTTGVVHRTSTNTWVARALDLQTDVSNVLSTTNGGTGNVLLTGYVKGDGIAGNALTSFPTIPGVDVSGDITGEASGVYGVIPITNGGTGATSRDGAATAILPVQSNGSINHVLVSNGESAEWRVATTGTVTSVGVTVDAVGIVVSNSPVINSGVINLELTGNIKALDTLADFGVLSRDASGNLLGHAITSQTNTVNIYNGLGAEGGDITFDLPVIKMPETLVSVNTDEYGRVTSGSSYIEWTAIASTPSGVAGYGITDVYTKSESNNLTWDWGVITSTPTSLAEYGITDVYTKSESNNLTWDWDAITSTPSTLARYGITDAIFNAGGVGSLAVNSTINRPAAGNSGDLFIDTSLNTLAFDNGGAWINVGNVGTVVSVDVTSNSSGLSITGGPVTNTGVVSIELDGELAAVEALTSVGFAVREGNSGWATRTILGTLGNITISNGDGIFGDPQIDLVDIHNGGTTTIATAIVDQYGRVVGGTPTLDWSSLVTVPTSVAGFGITDAVTTDTIGVPNGIATLDAIGKIPAEQLPALAITDVFVVADEQAMLLLGAQQGDVAIRTDVGASYILTTNSPTFASSWQPLTAAAAAAGVSYVNIASATPGLIVTNGPITSSGTINLTLAGNLAAVDALTTSGIVRKTGTVWSAGGTVSLTSDVTGILDVSHGGTGVGVLTGYIRGNGLAVMDSVTSIPGSDVSGNIMGYAANVTGIVTVANGGTGEVALSGYVYGNGSSAMSSTSTIPGADVLGDIAGLAANVAGIVDISHGGTGQTTTTAALNVLLPDQSTSSGFVLSTSDGVVLWTPIFPDQSSANGLFLVSNGSTVEWVSAPTSTRVMTNQITQLSGVFHIPLAEQADGVQELFTSSALTYDTSTDAVQTSNISATGVVTGQTLVGGNISLSSDAITNTSLVGSSDITINPSISNVGGVLAPDHRGAVIINGSSHIATLAGLGGNLTVDGNLTVSGEVTAINSVSFTTTANIIQIIPSIADLPMGLSVGSAGTGVLSSLSFIPAISQWNIANNIAIQNGRGIVYGGITGSVSDASHAKNLALVNTAELIIVPQFDVPNPSWYTIDAGTGGSWCTIELTDGVDIAGLDIINTEGWIVGTVYTMELVVIQPSTHTNSPDGVLISWPAAFKWSGGTPPVLSAGDGSVDIITLISYNSGITWLCKGITSNLI